MKWALVLWGLVLSTILSALAWGAVLFFVNPENATGFEWALFLLSLLLVLAGFCSLGILLLRRMLLGIDQTLMRVGTSVRQGLLLAVFLVGALLLVRTGWFVWWDAMLLFGFLFLVDLFFLWKFRVKKSG